MPAWRGAAPLLLSVALLLSLWLATRPAPAARSRALPRAAADAVTSAPTVSYNDFLASATTGDLLVTLDSNPHSVVVAGFTASPISHVCVVVAAPLPGPRRLAIFESSPSRGAQMRWLDDYVARAPKLLLWRRATPCAYPRGLAALESAMAELSEEPYAFDWAGGIVFEHARATMVGARELVDAWETDGSSCGTLVGRVLARAGALRTAPFGRYAPERLLPRHFAAVGDLDWVGDEPAACVRVVGVGGHAAPAVEAARKEALARRLLQADAL